MPVGGHIETDVFFMDRVWRMSVLRSLFNSKGRDTLADDFGPCVRGADIVGRRFLSLS